MITGGSASKKANALHNLIKKQDDGHYNVIDKIYLYVKDPSKTKYQLLINKRKSSRLEHYNDPKVFIEYSNKMDGIHKNIEEDNPNKKRKILIVFYDMTADMVTNKKFNLIVT